MLTALVLRPRNAFDLAATLATLVPGAVDGILREVVVVDAPEGEIEAVAEHAGCRVLSSPALLGDGFAPKGDWLLLVEAGERLPAGWIEASARHMGQAGGSLAGRVPATGQRSLLRRLLPDRRGGGWLVPSRGAFDRMRALGRVEASAHGLRVRRLRLDPVA